ncbi:MAG: acyltransferase family protein [Cyanobium sp.]
MTTYRPEIDGLRALAVIAVIINHFNNTLLPSGYLGVDIFFVISGYVITASFARHKSKNLADFLGGFYARRFKRLLPALLVFVVLISLLICLFNPAPQLILTTGISSLFGVSNLYLLGQSTDYFAQSTELNSFMHTWSLGVEEQFYLIFPLLIWMSGFARQANHGTKALFLILVVLTVASWIGFAVSYPANQAAAYFLMPTRFWEMAAGALLLIGLKSGNAFSGVLERVPPLPVLILMVAVMCLPLSVAVPATLAIVLLSVVLMACLRPDTLPFRLFTDKRVVFIGLISYSLYLWHWGVLSIARWSIGLSWWSVPLLLALTFACASASYRFIERPIRSLSINQRWLTFVLGFLSIAVATLLLSLLSLPGVSKKLALVNESDGDFQRGRLSQSNYVGPITNRHNNDCGSLSATLSASVIAESLKVCLWRGPGFDSGQPVVAFMGDSHAHQLFPVAEGIARDFGLPVYNFYYLNCIVPQDQARLTDPQCSKVNQAPGWFYQQIKRPTIFVIASVADPIINFPSEWDQKQAVQVFRQAFSKLLDPGNRLVVVAPNPKFYDLDQAISDTCRQTAWSRLNPICRKDYTFDAQAQREQRKFYMQALHSWAQSDSRVTIVDPFWFLCDLKDGKCHSRKDGRSKYWERSHLNLQAVLSTYPLYRKAIESILSDMKSAPQATATRQFWLD